MNEYLIYFVSLIQQTKLLYKQLDSPFYIYSWLRIQKVDYCRRGEKHSNATFDPNSLLGYRKKREMVDEI